MKGHRHSQVKIFDVTPRGEGATTEELNAFLKENQVLDVQFQITAAVNGYSEVVMVWYEVDQYGSK